MLTYTSQSVTRILFALFTYKVLIIHVTTRQIPIGTN